jgi:hypothetical protein
MRKLTLGQKHTAQTKNNEIVMIFDEILLNNYDGLDDILERINNIYGLFDKLDNDERNVKHAFKEDITQNEEDVKTLIKMYNRFHKSLHLPPLTNSQKEHITDFLDNKIAEYNNAGLKGGRKTRRNKRKMKKTRKTKTKKT